MSSNSPIDLPARRPRRSLLPVLLFFVACTGTLFAGFFLIEKTQSASAWQQYEEQARARGVKMDLMNYAPPAVPDAENFAAIPLFQDAFRAQAAGQPVPNPLALPMQEGIKQPGLDTPAKQQRIDLAAWQKFFAETGVLAAAGGDPAADVLAALRRYDEPLAQLRLAGARRACAFPVKYEDGISAALPHLQILQSAARAYALRMAAHLGAGQRGEALQDFRDGLRLYTATVNEPTLIAGLVRVSILNVLENAVWGGLAGGQWGDAELREIEAALAPLRLFADYELAMGSERGFGNQVYGMLIKQPGGEFAKLMQGLQGVGESPSIFGTTLQQVGLHLYPRGWILRSQLRSNQYLDGMLSRVTIDPPRLDLTKGLDVIKQQPKGTLDRMQHMHFYMLAPALETVERRYAAAQTMTDQTRLACALERYRLARGAYPATIEALAPEFIPAMPRDVMTGEPLRYRKEGGGFLLYGVGFNGRDDGGQTGEKSSVNDHLDWVWRYPAAERNVEK